MGKGKDTAQRKRRTKQQIEDEKAAIEVEAEALRAANQRFFGIVAAPTVVPAPPVEAPPPPVEAPPPPVDAAPTQIEMPVLPDILSPVSGNDPSYIRAIKNVKLDAVPPLFHGRVRSSMLEVRKWFKTSGNQNTKKVVGEWKWPNLDTPMKNPDMLRVPTPEDYLAPKLCRTRFFILELAMEVSQRVEEEDVNCAVQFNSFKLDIHANRESFPNVECRASGMVGAIVALETIFSIQRAQSWWWIVVLYFTSFAPSTNALSEQMIQCSPVMKKITPFEATTLNS